MDRSVEEIEDLRLKELRKQAALFGPQTDPAILIEIAELAGKGWQRTENKRGGYVNSLDFDLVRTTVAAALVRLKAVEDILSNSDRKRILRQLIHDIWMIAITVMVFFILLMLLMQK